MVSLKLLFVMAITTFFLTWILTARIRIYALDNRLLDIPNERSSHSQPTPRGGGVAFVFVFLFMIILSYIQGSLQISLTLALLGGGLLVAAAGWIDDRKGLSHKVRLLLHSIAAAWALFWLGGMPNMNIGFMQIHLGWIGNVLALLGIVWMTNLYNFMDGIDGLAGGEAITVAAIAGFLLVITDSYDLALSCFILFFSVSGFLVWNWPPAKIFMGDVGSGFLGYVFAVLMLSHKAPYSLPLLGWLILLGVFIIDATVTLIWRITKGHKWYEPHRTHVYQLAIQTGYTHRQVTLVVMGINMLLALIAIYIVFHPEELLLLFIITILILTILNIVLRKHFLKIIEDL